MTKNMGNTDRVLRVLLAALLVGLYLSDKVTGTFGLILMILAGVFILTSLLGYCPLYAPFNIRTLRTNK